MTNDRLIEGWAFPGAARKCHFFKAGEIRSLCGKWMHNGMREPEDGSASLDDCAACRRQVVEQLERRAPEAPVVGDGNDA